MEALDISFEDGSLAEFANRNPKHGRIVKFAGLDSGTTGGNPSIAIAVETDDGEIIIAELTYRLFQVAHTAYNARWGVVL